MCSFPALTSEVELTLQRAQYVDYYSLPRYLPRPTRPGFLLNLSQYLPDRNRRLLLCIQQRLVSNICSLNQSRLCHGSVRRRVAIAIKAGAVQPPVVSVQFSVQKSQYQSRVQRCRAFSVQQSCLSMFMSNLRRQTNDILAEQVMQNDNEL